MSDSRDWNFLSGVITGLVIMTVVAIFVLVIQGNNWRDAAVDHGAAEYYLNAQHQREWRWLTNR